MCDDDPYEFMEAIEKEADYADELKAVIHSLTMALENLVARIDHNGGLGEYKGGPAFVLGPARHAIALGKKYQ